MSKAPEQRTPPPPPQEQQEEQPLQWFQTLRSAEANLRVVVGAAPEDAREYHYPSALLAAYSAYIDTMLACPMKEQAEHVIYFPDLDAITWEMMIKFLHPVASRNMTAIDASKLAAAYDKYDFEAGRTCCDLVLSELFQNMLEDDDDGCIKPDNLSALIDTLQLADTAHLEQTKALGKQYFGRALNDQVGPYGRIMFTETMIKALVPLIVQEQLLSYEATGWTSRQILAPCFPRHFVDCAVRDYYRMQLEQAVCAVVLAGTSCKADGIFHKDVAGYSSFSCDRQLRWGETLVYDVYIAMLKDDWVIYGNPSFPNEEGDPLDECRVLWKCPYSSNRYILPPKSGWVPVDKLAQGQPKIKYIYREDDYC